MEERRSPARLFSFAFAPLVCTVGKTFRIRTRVNCLVLSFLQFLYCLIFMVVRYKLDFFLRRAP